MKNRFRGSTVLVMGCDGVTYTDLAQAFIDNGAELFISWDGPVSLEHTDHAYICVLTAMVEGEMSPREAAAYAMDAVGRDVDFNSTLTCFPR